LHCKSTKSGRNEERASPEMNDFADPFGVVVWEVASVNDSNRHGDVIDTVWG